MESSKLWLHPGVTCAAGYFYIFHLIWHFFHRLWLLPDLLPVKGTVHSKFKMCIFLSTFSAFYPSRLFWFEVQSFGYIGGREVCFHWCFLFYFVELLFVCRVVTSHLVFVFFPPSAQLCFICLWALLCLISIFSPLCCQLVLSSWLGDGRLLKSI